VIELAKDTTTEPNVGRYLRVAWFFAATLILPLSDLVRASTRLSLAGMGIYFVFLTLLIIAQTVVIRIGPNTLAYGVNYEVLVIETALRPIKVPFERIVDIELFSGDSLRYRSGLSLQNYHVGWYRAAKGTVRVAASRLQGAGLLITHQREQLFLRRRERLFISPAEPEVMLLALVSLQSDRKRRIELGQP
jgi:hypothetical protein